MPLHRLFTILLLLCTILHITAVGIRLPQKLFSVTDTSNVIETQEPSPDAGTANSENATDGSLDHKSEASQNPDTSSGEEAATEPAVFFSGAVLNDGTYQGTANGYTGVITVSVVVTNGAVTDISIVGQSETDRFFQQATQVLDTIVNQQSLEVDAVSGATFSSAGLINAVYNALQQAVESGTLKVTDIDVSSIQRRGKQ